MKKLHLFLFLAVIAIPVRGQQTSISSAGVKIKSAANSTGPITDAVSAGLITKEYKISPAFFDKHAFQLKQIRKFLIDQGVAFPEGATAQYLVAANAIIVRNTPDNIRVVDAIIGMEKSVEPTTGNAKPAAEQQQSASTATNGHVTDGSGQPVVNNAPIKPSAPIKVECRLLEMPIQQADMVEATLLRWQSNPAEQTHQLDATLWGNGARKLSELTGSGVSGTRCKSAGLEFEGMIDPNGSLCGITLVFDMPRVRPNTNSLTSTCTFTARNGLPVVLARIGFGSTVGLVVARCTWAAIGQASPTPPETNTPSTPVIPGNITLEYSLVEMPSGQANAVEAVLQRWLANPAEQMRQLDFILNGAGVKRIASLSGISSSGQRATIQNMDKPIFAIPYGANPATWPRQQTWNVGDSLEFEAVQGADGRICDVRSVFIRTRAHDGNHSIDSVKPTTSFSALNGLPILVARRDFGTSAELLLAKVTWASPVGASPAGGQSMPLQVYTRARIAVVSHMVAKEADKIKDDPKALAEWLKKRGTTRALVAVTTKSGQRAAFEHTDQEFFLTQGGTANESYNLGTVIAVEPTIGPDGKTVAINADVTCYQPKNASALSNSEITGRYMKTNAREDKGRQMTIAYGESAAIPCGEYKDLPSKGVPALKNWEPADDVFVVIEPVLPGAVSGDTHFYNTN
jgi:hypothetical protein